MVQLFFELPRYTAATLRNQANNDQNLIDIIVDFAVRKYLKNSPNSQESCKVRDLALRSHVVHKARSIAAKAHVNVDAVVEIALQQYFSQTRPASETLSAILQRLAGSQTGTTNA